jgi:hypothetical protein
MPSNPDYALWLKKLSELGELLCESPDKACLSALDIRNHTQGSEHVRLPVYALAILSIW